MSKLKKATAIAPSNLAFVKYWGRKDEELTIPANASLSVALDGMTTTTTVEFVDTLKADEVTINNELVEGASLERIVAHIDRVRRLANVQQRAQVVSHNSFPVGTGLSSSASGFAALSASAASAAGLELSEKDLSILARQGSGSACRSVPSGFTEWVGGDTSSTSYSHSIFSTDHWDLSLVVAVVSEKPKHISSVSGAKTVSSSSFFETRKKNMASKMEAAKTFLEQKDFTELGTLVEHEALELHAIMITQKPALIYWSTGTLSLMQLCQQWREDGIIESYFSINTGQDIYFMVKREDESKLVSLIQETKLANDIIINHPGEGTRLNNEHLF